MAEHGPDVWPALRVLAVDPGPHTGLALWEDAIPGYVPHPNTETFRSWESTPYPALDEIRELVIEGVDAVVIEGFRIGGQRGAASSVTIEMIGVTRWICHKRGVHFVEQDPGLGKKFAGARWAKLRRLDWYRPGPDHANSAAGHLLFYLAQNAPGFAERLAQQLP